MTATYVSHKPDMEELARDIIGRLGDLEILTTKHGMLGEAIKAVRAGTASAADLSLLRTQMDELGDDLRDYAAVL